MLAEGDVLVDNRPEALRAYPNATFDGVRWWDGPYWYDERAASQAARFFPEHLVFSEGEWAGKPFVLEPWEEHDIIRPLFGWKRADGTRRTFVRNGSEPRIEISDPAEAHRKMVMALADKDMHDVTAYLWTVK
jgi:hypothetical protein